MGSFGNNTTMGKGDNKGLLKALNWFSVLCGLVTIGAGVMGCVWGVKVLKPWPPLTWNNFVGGLFMFGFGFAIVWMALKESNDTGFFFLFIGMRVIPLGKFYCLVAGIVIFIFGLVNIGLHFKIKGDEGDDYSYSKIAGSVTGDS